MGRLTALPKAFWVMLLLVFVLHLPYLFAPTFTGSREWEQADRAAISRNFATESMQILYPRIDLRGHLSGIEGTEFPLYHYIVASVYKLTGSTWDGFGKLLSLISALVALSFLYRLVLWDYPELIHSNKLTAIFMAATALTPYFFRFSILFLPDMFALCLAAMGFYWFHVYRFAGRANALLWLSALAFALACLSRPYMIFFALPYCWHFFRNLNKPLEVLKLLLVAVVILAPFAWWYFHWVPYLNYVYRLGGYFFMGRPLLDNLHAIVSAPLSFLLPLLSQIAKFYMGWVLLPFFVVGVVSVLRSNTKGRYGVTKNLLAVALVALIVIPCTAGDWLFKQRYYLGAIYPGMVFASFYAMRAWLQHWSPKAFWVIVLLLVVMYAGSLSHYFVHPRFKMSAKQKLELLKGVAKNDLLVTVSDQQGNPMYLYMLDRKGWAAGYDPNQAALQQRLRSYQQHGARFVLFVRKKPHSKTVTYNMAPIAEVIKPVDS